MNKVVRKKRRRGSIGYRVKKQAKRAAPVKLDTRAAGVHRAPATLFDDAIQRSLGWESEGELRHLVHQYTGYQLSLDEANLFSQEVAELVLRALRRKP